MTDTIDDAGAGVDLARRAILAYCNEGDRGALRVINGAQSARELGYCSAYLIDALRKHVEILTGGREAANELLRKACTGIVEDSVATQVRLILGEGDEH